MSGKQYRIENHASGCARLHEVAFTHSAKQGGAVATPLANDYQPIKKTAASSPSSKNLPRHHAYHMGAQRVLLLTIIPRLDGT